MADITQPIVNLVPWPILDQDWVVIRTDAWLVSTDDEILQSVVGGTDRRGNPAYGLDLNNRSSNTLIEVPEGYDLAPLEPGDELQIWLTGSPSITAGLYRNRGGAATDQVDIEPKSATEPGAILVVPEGDGDLWLKLEGGSDARARKVRLSPAGDNDGLGIFDGNNDDTEELEYQWSGDAEFSASVAVPVGWEPTPEEPEEPEEPGEPGEPGTSRIAQRVKLYLDDSELNDAMLIQQIDVVTAYVYGYTRGRGFKTVDHDIRGGMVKAIGEPTSDVESVIVAAVARLATNPDQVTYYQTGDYSERPAVLAGWTLLERAVLNNYRVRWA